MPDHERAMLAYARLAAIAWQKRQLPGRDKFLLLAAASACRAGWPDVAERCRELVLAHNPLHLVGHEEAFVVAMRSPDFGPFVRQLERFCSPERAEHLLAELGIEVIVPSVEDERRAGDIARELLLPKEDED
jgi:hypothetical protein